MDEDEQQLRTTIENYTKRGDRSAFLVIAALVFEAGLAWWFSAGRPFVETCLLVAVDLTIAVGVYGEIHFANAAKAAVAELQRISDERVAAANASSAQANERASTLNERATRLELELEQLRRNQLPRASRLLAGPFETLLRQGPPGTANVWYPPEDTEAYSLAIALHGVLVSCGWQIQERPRPIPPNMIGGTIIPPESAAYGLLDFVQDVPREVRAAGGFHQDVSMQTSIEELERPTPPARPIDVLRDAFLKIDFRPSRGGSRSHPSGYIDVIVNQK